MHNCQGVRILELDYETVIRIGSSGGEATGGEFACLEVVDGLVTTHFSILLYHPYTFLKINHFGEINDQRSGNY